MKQRTKTSSTHLYNSLKKKKKKNIAYMTLSFLFLEHSLEMILLLLEPFFSFNI